MNFSDIVLKLIIWLLQPYAKWMDALVYPFDVMVTFCHKKLHSIHHVIERLFFIKGHLWYCTRGPICRCRTHAYIITCVFNVIAVFLCLAGWIMLDSNVLEVEMYHSLADTMEIFFIVAATLILRRNTLTVPLFGIALLAGGALKIILYDVPERFAHPLDVSWLLSLFILTELLCNIVAHGFLHNVAHDLKDKSFKVITGHTEADIMLSLMNATAFLFISLLSLSGSSIAAKSHTETVFALIGGLFVLAIARMSLKTILRPDQDHTCGHNH